MEKLISLVRFPNYVPGKTVAKWFGDICVTVTADFVWLANHRETEYPNTEIPVKRIIRFLVASRLVTKMDMWEVRRIREELEEIASK